MALLNDNYLKLKAGYLFPEIARRVTAFAEANPALAGEIIRCGIGDVTEPLPPAVVAALHKAVDEMAARASFKGYGPEQGYDFLREKKIQGSSMGSNRFRVDMPRLLNMWKQGRLKLDHMISGHIKLDEINEGYATLKKGTQVRQLIKFN